MIFKPTTTTRAVIDPLRKCNIKCKFCLTGDTKILNYNLDWINIKDIKINDKIIGFKRNDFLKESIVTAIGSRETDVYEILTENGSVKCTKDHLWLNEYGKWFSLDNRIKIGSVRANIKFLSKPTDNFNETEDYMKGYISGILDGDGCMNESIQKGKWKCRWFSIRVRDYEIIETSHKYLKYFGIDIPMTISKQYYKNKIYEMHRLECRDADRYNKIYNLTEYKDTDEFKRGWISGIFDAEGSHNSVIRIAQYNINYEIKERIKLLLEQFNFKTKWEKDSIRLVGGLSEKIRFFSFFKPKIKRKIYQKIKKISYSKILKISHIGKQTVYDIQTTTGNFYANGFASHNCYYLHDDMTSVQPFDKVKREVDEARQRDNDYIDITGGEPFCYPEIVELVQYINSKSMRACIITNALAGENATQKVLDAGIDDFLVSIHGMEKTHDMLVQHEGARKKQERFIEQIQKKLKFRFNCVISKYNQNELINMANYMVKWNVYMVNFINFNPHHQWKFQENVKDVIADFRIVEPQLNEAIRILEDKGIGVNVRYYPMCRIADQYRRCICNDLQVALDPYEWDYNIMPKTLDEFIKWGKATSKGTELKTEPCSLCDLQNICGGINKYFYRHAGDPGIITPLKVNGINKDDFYAYRKFNKTLESK